MTTATAELCGHRWAQTVGDGWWHATDHDCTKPANHHPVPCYCRCGATTTKETK